MNNPNTMSDFLTHLFDAWNAADIRYLILRNYEELPEFTGNDIDVLLDPAQVRTAEKVLRQAADDKGWRIHNIGEFSCRALYLFNIDTLEQVHIDLMCGVKWRSVLFADHHVALTRRRLFENFYIPAATDEAAVSLMTRLIYAGYVKESYRDGIRRVAGGSERELVGTLAPWVGVDLAEKIVTWAAEGRWEKIETCCSKVRKNILLANLRMPGRLLTSLLRDAFRFVRRVLRSPGLSLVFFGPDGCGKTSVADGLKGVMEKTFSPEKVLHCHWKPVRPKGGMCAPTVDPHGQAPRNPAASLIYFVYHYLPFIWGWWCHVKPVLFKGGLVIIDRYYYDFFVDLNRYRLNLPQWIVRLGFVFVKKPDLVFCLDAAPEILQARKKEVSFEECKRQREAYRALAEKLSNGQVIDSSQSLEKVVQDVQRIILEFMAGRSEKKRRKKEGLV